MLYRMSAKIPTDPLMITSCKDTAEFKFDLLVQNYFNCSRQHLLLSERELTVQSEEK